MMGIVLYLADDYQYDEIQWPPAKNVPANNATVDFTKSGHRFKKYGVDEGIKIDNEEKFLVTISLLEFFSHFHVIHVPHKSPPYFFIMPIWLPGTTFVSEMKCLF